MNNLYYIIPAAIAGVGIAVGLAYNSGAFSVEKTNNDTSFVDKAFEGGKRKRNNENKKTKRRNK